MACITLTSRRVGHPAKHACELEAGINSGVQNHPQGRAAVQNPRRLVIWLLAAGLGAQPQKFRDVLRDCGCDRTLPGWLRPWKLISRTPHVLLQVPPCVIMIPIVVVIAAPCASRV